MPIFDAIQTSHAPSQTSSRMTVVIIVAAVLLSDAFAYGGMITILPSMLENAGGQSEDLQPLSSLVVSTHAATSMAGFPIAGLICDKLSTRKKSLIIGLLAFTISTFAFYQATSILGLLLAKGAQGFFSSLMWVAGMSLCFDAGDLEKFGTTVGTVLSANDVGALLAPPLGGLIYASIGQFGLCAASISLLVIAIIMTLAISEERVLGESISSSIDLAQGKIEFSTLADSLSHPNVNEGPEQDSRDSSDDSTVTYPAIDIRFILEPSKSWILSQVPILRCLRNPSLVVAVAICIVQAALLGASDAAIPLETKQLFEFDSTIAGVVFLLLGLARLTTGPIGGWLVDRHGPKVVGVIGYSSLVLPLLLFDSVRPVPRAPQAAFYCGLQVLVGSGMGIVSTVSFVEAGRIVQKYQDANPGHFGTKGAIASLYGLVLMVYSFGMTVGSLLAGDFLLLVGYGNMMSVLAVLSCLAAIACYICLEDKTYDNNVVVEKNNDPFMEEI